MLSLVDPTIYNLHSQIQNVAIVDDDMQAAHAMSVLVRDAGFEPVEVPLSSFALDDLISSVKNKAQAAVCDHRLRHGGRVHFTGAEAVATLLHEQIPAILVTQYIATDVDVSIRRWRDAIPVVLSRDEASDPQHIRSGLLVAAEEIRGRIMPERRAWRSLVEIDDLSEDSGEPVVEARVPQWNPNEVVRFPLALVPREMRDQVAPGGIILAQVNIGAVTQKDLYFSGFEVAPKPIEEDELG